MRKQVHLSDDDAKFLKWLAKEDEVSFEREIQQVFDVELFQLKEIYSWEETKQYED